MEERALQKLGYEQIIALLAERCSSQLGKELANKLRPSFDLEKIKRWQMDTTQATEVLRLYPEFSLGGLRDIRRCLSKAKRGGVIEPGDFLLIADTLLAFSKTKAFFRGERGQKYPFLVEYIDALPILTDLEREIKQKITEEGEVGDQASSELLRLRKQLRKLQGNIREKLESMIRSTKMQKYLQEPLITIRNERYVIPVKNEYRGQVPGLIHDQSASGATLFIEPLAVVEINNDVRRYENMEKAEVLRILREMSQLVATHEGALRDILQALAQLDFILAKGNLSHDLDCGEPRMNNYGYVQIIQGRHPLIKGKVVPITIHLGSAFDTLIITGPNTGGKTVSLKTVGLFVLMAQSGLHVPAQAGTELSVFTGVYADIGDEQSIEQSLSTFSSHLINIVEILQKADSRSLVLLDELGAGTDPAEGAALAKAILEHFISAGAKIIATTHYSELKSYAFNKERVENACVEFDIETLQPTYRLLIGVPGRSNAFEISYKLGMPQKVVEQARSFLSQTEVRTADLLANLETSQLIAEKKQHEAQKIKTTVERQWEVVEKKEEELKCKEKKVMQKAQQEALEIVREARQESDSILKEIRKAQKTIARQTVQEMQALAGELQKKETALAEVAFRQLEAEVLSASEIKPGMMVLLKRLNQQVLVLEKSNDNNEVLVQAGLIRVLVSLQELGRVEKEVKEQEQEKTGVGKIVSAKARDIKNELHLRGLTVEEALLKTEKYLDDAYLAGLSQVCLIHGKGSGTLRNVISDLLKNHSIVASFRLGGYHEGGHGVTMVELKK